ncbi:unnamed protein product (macronuclear) [Paramecium tetraurelia]|uniref:Uncharacterized protein n=1 Tax=Paramecium tetraurelia TaxID=5888 RepID=A0CI82_PARTE|nr:uncharacterized protein GSPATT00007634001 [Paramecium tetraurelia]CAK70499.1 unnamed protein product [Paramecium tetraurelia]|eukprot:XP_001437896.1 hypothetical protein (macronuclear) [Paramecium tetraurelia strain d4-2]
MQSIEYHPITKLILNGDTSPINEDEQKFNSPLKRFSNHSIALEISKNKTQRRKRSIQMFTDELISWNNYLHHKFQHSDQVSHGNGMII